MVFGRVTSCSDHSTELEAAMRGALKTVAGMTLLAAALSGCAGVPSPVETSALVEGEKSFGMARVTIRRPRGQTILAEPAMVSLNGETVATVGAGDLETIEVPAGESTFTVAPWSHPTTATLKLVAKAGETVELVVTPKGGSAGGLHDVPDSDDTDTRRAASGGAFDIKLKPQG